MDQGIRTNLNADIPLTEYAQRNVNTGELILRPI